MAARARNGNSISTHFKILAWLLEGPPRTKKEMSLIFTIRFEYVALYMKIALEQGLIKENGRIKPIDHGGAGPMTYLPVRKLGDRPGQTLEDLREPLGSLVLGLTWADGSAVSVDEIMAELKGQSQGKALEAAA